MYDTYNAKSMDQMHFKKLLDGSYIHKWDGQEVSKKRVKEKDEIKGMNGGEFPQGHVIEEMQIEEPFCIEHPYEVVQISHHEWNMPTEETFSTKSNFSKMSLSLAIELIAPYSSPQVDQYQTDLTSQISSWYIDGEASYDQ